MKGPGTKELNQKCGAGHDTSGVINWSVFLVWDFLRKHVQFYGMQYHGCIRSDSLKYTDSTGILDDRR
jgi:hypothetical protein